MRDPSVRRFKRAVFCGACRPGKIKPCQESRIFIPEEGRGTVCAPVTIENDDNEQ